MYIPSTTSSDRDAVAPPCENGNTVTYPKSARGSRFKVSSAHFWHFPADLLQYGRYRRLHSYSYSAWRPKDSGEEVLSLDPRPTEPGYWYKDADIARMRVLGHELVTEYNAGTYCVVASFEL